MVGDAAGFVDPFVGDGISLALRSGALAAQCLTPFFAGEASLPDAVSRYSEEYKQSLLPVFRASSKIRQDACLAGIRAQAAFISAGEQSRDHPLPGAQDALSLMLYASVFARARYRSSGMR